MSIYNVVRILDELLAASAQATSLHSPGGRRFSRTRDSRVRSESSIGASCKRISS